MASVNPSANRAIPQKRVCSQFAMNLTTALNTTGTQDIGEYVSGSICIPAGSPITTLTFYTAPVIGGTYAAAYDTTPSAIVLTVAAGRNYPLPAAIFGAGAMAIVVNSAGSVTVTLKT